MKMQGLKKRIAKNVRGKMTCRNPKCAAQIPIHSAVCKFCGFVSKKKQGVGHSDRELAGRILTDASALDGLSKAQFGAARDFFLNAMYEVRIFRIRLTLEPLLR